VLGYNYPGDVWYRDAYRLMTSRGLRPSLPPGSSNGTGGHLPRIFPHFGKHRESTLPPPAAPTPPTTVSQSDTPTPPAPPAEPKKKTGLFHSGLGFKRSGFSAILTPC